MAASVERQRALLEVKTPDRPLRVEVNKVDGDSLEQSKVALGRDISEAIAGTPRKVYGDDALMSGICSGDKVPDYLARIYRDRIARRKLGFAFLRGTGVRKHVSLEWDEEVGD